MDAELADPGVLIANRAYACWLSARTRNRGSSRHRRRLQAQVRNIDTEIGARVDIELGPAADGEHGKVVVAARGRNANTANKSTAPVKPAAAWPAQRMPLAVELYSVRL